MHRIGVCSWSLRPEGPEDLAQKVRACGVGGVQLALDPIRTGAWDERLTSEAIRAAGLDFLSGMMAATGEDYSTLETIRRTGGLNPDEHWETNRAAAAANAQVAQRLGITLVTLHAGVFPEDVRSPRYEMMLHHVREVAALFESAGALLALETGQETAETLLAFLKALGTARIGVNFDPANMILYGSSEPIAALEALAPWVRQVHIKDAIPPEKPGQWGTETVVGEGAVRWPEFFAIIRDQCPDVNLVIEREAGETRIADLRVARALVQKYIS